MSANWLRFRVPLGFILAAWYLILAHPQSPGLLAVCAILVSLGCALRSWAAGYLFKGKRVAVGGPYAFVRNPLYLGSFLIATGFCSALFDPPVPTSVDLFTGVFLLGFAGLYFAKSQSEEEELRTSLGPAYVTYRAQVPAFLPWRGHVHGLGQQTFSGELYSRNREYQCVLGSMAIFFVIVLKGHYAG